MAPRWQWLSIQNKFFDPSTVRFDKFHLQVFKKSRACEISIFDTIERSLTDKECQLIDISDMHGHLFIILTPTESYYAKCTQNQKNIIHSESLVPTHVSKMLKTLTSGSPLVLQIREESLVTSFDIIDKHLTTYATLISFEPQNQPKSDLLVIAKQGYNKPYKKIISALQNEHGSTEVCRYAINSQTSMRLSPINFHSDNKSTSNTNDTFDLIGHFLHLYAIGLRDASKWLTSQPDPVLIHELRIALQKSSNILQILIGFYRLIDLSSVNDEIKYFRKLSSSLRDLELLGGFIDSLSGQPSLEIDFYRLKDSICVDIKKEYLNFINIVRSARFENLETSMLRLAGRSNSLRFTETPLTGIKSNIRSPHSNLRQNEIRAVDPFQAYLFRKVEAAASHIQSSARNLSTSASIDSLHNLRKDIRRLRYTIELLTPKIENKTAIQLLSGLRRAQTVLGDYHDLFQQNELISMYCIDLGINRLKLRPLNDELNNHLRQNTKQRKETLKILASFNLRAEVRLALDIRKK